MHHHFLDRFSGLDSPLHRRDPRAKLLLVLAYTALLVSVDRYQVARLAPFAILPFAWLVFGNIPLRYVGKQVVLCSPFLVFVAVFNPLYDHSVHVVPTPWGTLAVGGGWLIAANLTIKFVLGLSALVALSATTRFADLLAGMQRLGVPRLLVMQLAILYRYLFVLIDQAQRVVRARSARLGSAGPVGARLRASGGMVGSLFVRTLESAERIHAAMEARGYDGQIRTLRRLRFGAADAVLLAGGVAYAVLCRFHLELAAWARMTG